MVNYDELMSVKSPISLENYDFLCSYGTLSYLGKYLLPNEPVLCDNIIYSFIPVTLT